MYDLDPLFTRIEAAIKASGEARPVFCTDADGTLWHGELGQVFLAWLADKQILEPQVVADFESRRARWETDAFAFATWVMAGLRERELREYAGYFVERFWKRHVYPEMAALVAAVERLGVEVWVLSASNRWVVEEAMSLVGLPRTRAIAMSVKVVRGLLTDQLDEPLLNREGKVEAIDRFIGRRPLFAAGNTLNDLPMLHAATAGAIMVNPSSLPSEELGTSPRAYAWQKGWEVLDLEWREDGA
jgi:phosphoserine phosphatase